MRQRELDLLFQSCSWRQSRRLRHPSATRVPPSCPTPALELLSFISASSHPPQTPPQSLGGGDTTGQGTPSPGLSSERDFMGYLQGFCYKKPQNYINIFYYENFRKFSLPRDAHTHLALGGRAAEWAEPNTDPKKKRKIQLNK